MPYLHLDLPGTYPVQVKRELATRLCKLYAESMETQLWRPNVGIAELGKDKSMSTSPSKRTALMAYTRFNLERSTPSVWRVTFNHPPINLIDSVVIGELGELFAEVERNEGPAVLVFDSADPDYFLAHYD